MKNIKFFSIDSTSSIQDDLALINAYYETLFLIKMDSKECFKLKEKNELLIESRISAITGEIIHNEAIRYKVANCLEKQRGLIDREAARKKLKKDLFHKSIKR